MLRPALLAGLAGLLPLGQASAAMPTPVISGLAADPWGPANADPTEIYVVGDAHFFGEDPVTVGTDAQGDGDRREVGLMGMDARNLAIWQPDLNVDTLWFAMSVWDFTVLAPEITSWRWTFLVDGVPYRLEAARGGLTLDSTIQGGLSPLFTQSGIDAFRLLGPCNAAGTECPFYGAVDGQFDQNPKLITWRVPMTGPLEQGALIAPHPLGGSTVFGVGSATYQDRVEQRSSYRVSSPKVEVWLTTTAGDQVTPAVQAYLPPLDSDQPFWTNLILPSGLDTGPIGPNKPYDVVARACANVCGDTTKVGVKL